MIDRGFVRGAVVQRKGAGAPEDGAGPVRRRGRRRQQPLRPGPRARSATREWPYGTAIRGYWESPLHDEPWIESAST